MRGRPFTEDGPFKATYCSVIVLTLLPSIRFRRGGTVGAGNIDGASALRTGDNGFVVFVAVRQPLTGSHILALKAKLGATIGASRFETLVLTNDFNHRYSSHSSSFVTYPTIKTFK